MPPSIDIVFPCLDEVAALPWLLARIPNDCRAIVVDNGSTDGSPEMAEQLGATVVRCAQRGYGAACHAGLEAASARFVAVCDCDGTLDPTDIPALAERLSGADLVLARRVPTSRDAWPWSARLANRELARRVSRRTGVRIRDVGPLRIAGREPLLSLDLRDRRFGYPVETVVRAAAAGWTIEQADVAYRPRFGESKVTGTLGGCVRAVRDMSAVLSQ